MDGRQEQGNRLFEHSEKRTLSGFDELAAGMFPGSHILLDIVLRTVVVYLVVLLGVRLSGKREVGQMTPFDLVLILLIANSVQNAMVGPDTTILGGVLAATTLLVANRVTASVSDRVPFVRRTFEGEPSLLVSDGRLIDDHVRRAGVSADLVLQAIREHGFENLSDVRMAVLEVDGTISIVPKEAQTVRTRRRVRGVRAGGG